MSSFEINPEIWLAVQKPNESVEYQCKICNDRVLRSGKFSLARHEKTTSHIQHQQRHAHQQSTQQAEAASAPPSIDPAVNYLSNVGVFNLASSFSQSFNDLTTTAPSGTTTAPSDSFSHPNPTTAGGAMPYWDDLYDEDTSERISQAMLPQQTEAWGGILASMVDMMHDEDERRGLVDDIDSDYEPEDELPPEPEESDFESDDDESSGIPAQDTSEDPHQEGPPRKRARQGLLEPSDRWFPWPDRISCTLDILMHLPRSVFSQRQLDLFLWLLNINNVPDVPSVKSMQRLNAQLQQMCGIDTIEYQGKLGHTYHVNNLAQIIAQELANPQIRKHLSFYPQDNGPTLGEARQADRWLNEAPEELLTPMARIKTKDFYIHEPALAHDGHNNGLVVMPFRWFMGGDELHARCWDMSRVVTDSSEAWRITKDSVREIPASHFLVNFPSLQEDYKRYKIPDPGFIHDVTEQGVSSKWTLTNPVKGNVWRERADGCRVVSFPIWLYCDDTSGNVSKKWNEHNSFLFTAAGLDRSESQKDFNVHFLSTSNIAPPLEMLDGIAEQITEAQEHGIWAWDCAGEGGGEAVLIIPFVLALLGDNPMQSEFACHIGMRGKFFCRNCDVKGKDASDTNEGGTRAEANASDDESDGDADDAGQKKGKRRKGVLETFSVLMARISRFMKPGKPREVEDTLKALNTQFTYAIDNATRSKVKTARTATGIKDTFQDYFLGKLDEAVHKLRGDTQRRDALNKAIKELPAKK
ncbi:hypothetical protein BDZ89DRAFT_1169723 [Hymenopellis radicata]|nr:hypothetical protein BDZ89DRAFT_1169723 [Hymenopellis radicata]